MDDKFNLDDIKALLSDYENQEESAKPDLQISDIKAEVDKSNSKVEISGNEINSEVVKPDFVSITDAFEAIRSEKQDSDKKTDASDSDAETYSDNHTDLKDKPEDKEKESVEIFAEIDAKRYFSTEEFNSIKNKSSNDIKQSLSSFAKGEEEQDDGEEEYFKTAELTEEIDDFDSPEEREDVLMDLKRMNSSASFKSFLTFLLTVFSGIIFFAYHLGFSIPGLEITSGSRLVLTIVFSVSLVASIVNFNTLSKGLVSLLKFKCTADSMLFFAFVFNTALDVIYLLTRKNFNGNFVYFDFIYMLLLMFNIFSKKLLAKNIYKNFLIASSDGQKMVVDRPEMEDLVNDIILETGNGGDILYATKSRFVTDFIHNSFKDFELFNKGSGFYMFCTLTILVLSVITYFITDNFVHAFAYAAGAFCVVSPILFAFSFAVPIFINSSKARRSGGAIVGSESAYALSDAQTIIVDDSDVFNVALNGIRLYGDSEIEDSIIYLCSLYNSVGGPLKPLFLDMLSEDITSLPRADEIYYHDTMGYSCLIHSKVFIVGNKQLMDHFGIDVDDSEFEIIYQQKSKNVLFVAYDNQLMGVFLLTYSLSHSVSKAFSIFEADQMNVAIAERDANITSTLLHNSFKSADKSLFTVMNFRTARNCFKKFELRSKTPSILLSNAGLKGIASAIHGCKSMLFALKTNGVIRIITSIMALILITFLLAFSEPSSSLPVHILAYHLLWSLPILFVSLFSK